ncbi:MAG: hypothetical protein AAFU80_10250 [Pseudomonadota bacterium]
MRAGLLSLVVLLALASCREAPEAPQAGTVGVDVGQAAQEACEARGGRFGLSPGSDPEGPEIRRCFIEPADANARCSSSTECEGVCLARSRTCAPVIPLLGCYEVLGAGGAQSTLCVD